MQVGFEELNIIIIIHAFTRRALDRAHVPPTKVFRRLAVNKTILKPRLAAATGGQNVYVKFSRRNKIPRCSAYTTSEKAIRFRHPNWHPVPASGSGSKVYQFIHVSTSVVSTRNSNVSSKSMHVFSSNLANRQTDKHGQKHLPPPLSEVNNACTFSDDTESVTRWAAW